MYLLPTSRPLVSGDIATWCVRIGDRYYHLQDSRFLSHLDAVLLCEPLYAAHLERARAGAASC
jgi:hypothetical protein